MGETCCKKERDVAPRKYGWVPDLPDHRDVKYKVPEHIRSAPLPAAVDLRPGCPPVYDQGQLGSCTANAIAGAIEFDRKKEKLVDFTPSRLFIYWLERAMENTIQSDAGAQIRDGVKGVARKGAPPEASWPYDISKFAEQAPPSVWGEAFHHKTVKYYSLEQNAHTLMGCLAEGYPFIFGFTVYDGFESDVVAQTGVLDLPGRHESVQGGHAVLAVGYDYASKRFLVRNSWGDGWGQAGYFTMPFGYLTNSDLADDIWTIRSTK